MHNIQLPSGGAMPALGMGTLGMLGVEGIASIRQALDIGYRHLDTAQLYGNESEVGQAVKRSGLGREKVFITTKVDINNLAAEKLAPSVEQSLAALGSDYIDLLLIHWPSATVPLAESLAALQKLQASGKVKDIGVSNFTVALMKEAVEDHGVQLAANQVEYHINLSQEPVLTYVRAHNMALIAYAPIGRGKFLEDPILKAIAEKHKKSPAQIALRWLVQQPGVAAIPRSTNAERAAANFNIFDFDLTAEDIAALNALPKDIREFKRHTPGITWDNAA